MKKRYIILVIILLNIFNLSTFGYGISYDVGVEVDDEIIYEVKFIDIKELKEVIGNNWNEIFDSFKFSDEPGSKLKIRIVEIFKDDFYGSNKIGYATIKIDRWRWTKADFSKNADDSIKIGIIYDPTKLKDDTNYLLESILQMISTPVEDFLLDLKKKLSNNLLENITIDLKSFTLAITKEYKEECQIKASYDEGIGIMTKFQILKKDDTIIYELNVSDFINENNIIILVLQSLSLIISIIYIIIKNQKKTLIDN